MAFVTGKTVPAVINVALLASHALKAENRFLEAGSALITVRIGKALGVCTIYAAGTASTAAVLIPVVVTAVPALHAVFPVRKRCCLQQANQHYEAKQY